jgi:iron complex transport system permease protein
MSSANEGLAGIARQPVPVARLGATYVGSLALLALAVVAGISVGRYAVDPARVFIIIGHGLLDPFRELAEVDERIVMMVRVPRVLLAALCGAALAVSGAALQGVFRNPLVSPQVLGISQGAAFGGAMAILFGIWGLPLLVIVFLAGLSALALVGFIARINGRSEIVTVILSGMIVGAMFTALVSLAQFLADPNGPLPAIVYWLMGSFASTTWERLLIAAPGLAVGMIVLWGLRFRLNVLALDEAEARSLGARPDLERWLVFALVAFIVGSQVAVSGIVGWIGLVIPHAARLLVGHDHRALLPASMLLGAAYLVAVDTLARTATTAEIPLGILTALVGAPVFAMLLRNHYRERSGS